MQPGAPRVARPGEEAGADIRSSSPDSPCAQVGPAQGETVWEAATSHLRGVHFPWNNHLKKRVLF